MSDQARIEARLEQWLEESAAPQIPEYVDAMLGRTRSTRQRPGWMFAVGAANQARDPGRWIRLQPAWMLVLLVLLVVAGAVVAAGALLRRTVDRAPVSIPGVALPAILLTGDDAVWAGRATEILRLDPLTNAASAVVTNLPFGHHSAVGVGGSLWAVHDELGTVSEYNARTGQELTTIALAAGQVEPLVAYGSLWVSNYRNGSVTRIDTAARAAVASFDAPDSGLGGPTAMAAGGGLVWLANANGDRVLAIDPATNGVARELPFCGEWIAYLHDRLWVANCGLPGYTIRDPDTGSVAGLVEIDALGYPVDAAGRVWLPLRFGGPGTTTLVGIDPESLKITRSYVAPGVTEAFVAGFDSFWLSSAAGTEVVRVPFSTLPERDSANLP